MKPRSRPKTYADHWKKVLEDFYDYFSTLAKEDPAKFNARKEVYDAIQVAITQQDPDLFSLCERNIAKYKGKLGDGRFAAVLSPFAAFSDKEDDKKTQMLPLIRKARNDLDTAKEEAFKEKILAFKEKLGGAKESYLATRKYQLNNQDSAFFSGKKVDPEITRRKIEIAEQLTDSIDPGNLAQTIIAIIVADGQHQDFLKENKLVGKQGELGKLIEEAKDLVKKYLPAQYNEFYHLYSDQDQIVFQRDFIPRV